MNKTIQIALHLILASTGLQATSLHTFLVCDTNAQNIGYSVGQNLETLQKELYLAAKNTGLELQEHIYSENSANSGFLKDLEALEVSDDDVILFYWAGHGYRAESKESLWPSFSFANDPREVDLDYVARLLISKDPRLLLVFADTCNSIIPEKNAPPLAHERHFAKDLFPYEIQTLNYASLFLNSEGAYLASSSTPGQYSWYHAIGGGFFTNALIQSLQEELQRPEGTDWMIILEKARIDPSYETLPEVQTPQYQHLTFRTH